MHRSPRLPARFPANTKYVVEARGPWVHRFVEFPDGRKVSLRPRKTETCACVERQAGLARRIAATAQNRKRLVAAIA